MDLPAAIEKYWAHLVVGVGGLWTIVRFRADQDAKRRETAAATMAAKAVAKLDLTKLAHEAAADIIKTLREEIDHWTAEVEKLRLELADARLEHGRMIASKEAEIALLQARLREADAKIDAYRRFLVREGVVDPDPKTFDALEVAADGHLKPMGDME